MYQIKELEHAILSIYYSCVFCQRETFRPMVKKTFLPGLFPACRIIHFPCQANLLYTMADIACNYNQ